MAKKKATKKKTPTKGETIQEITDLLGKIEEAEEAVERAEIDWNQSREEAKTAKGVWMTTVSNLRELVRTRKRWAEEAKRQPLLNQKKNVKADAPAADGKPWREWDLEHLQLVNEKVTDRHLKALHESKIDNLGELADLMDRATTWWHREVKNVGPDTCTPIEDALATIRAQQSEPEQGEAIRDETESEDHPCESTPA